MILTSLPPLQHEKGGGCSETKDTLMKPFSFGFVSFDLSSMPLSRHCHATEQRTDGVPEDNQPSVTLAIAHSARREGEEWVATLLASLQFLFHSHLSFHFPLPTSIHFLCVFIHSSQFPFKEKLHTHVPVHTHRDADTRAHSGFSSMWVMCNFK